MTVTYDEIEAEYSWDIIKPAHKTGNTATSYNALASVKAVAEDYATEYQHLRECGLSNDDIAAKFDTTWDAFVARMHRAGIHLDTRTADVKRQQKILDRLIAAGTPFTAEHFPLGEGELVVNAMLAQASKLGRIVKVGSQPSHTRQRISIWQGVQAGAAAA